MSLNEDQILKIVNQYKKQREREKLYYQEKKKNDVEFIKKNRERARNHYLNNKEKKKDKYDENKEFRRVKALYYYYKKKDNLEKFRAMQDKVDILNDGGFTF
tara:strand:- start:724 stop:1029 length:306 start_codon:yes stop_codon:yes gene_type:complete